jgi:cell division protein FtsL
MEWIAFAASAVTAVLSFLGVYISNRKNAAVMEWRIKSLEEKVDRHNQVIERTYKLEQKVADMEKKGA